MVVQIARLMLPLWMGNMGAVIMTLGLIHYNNFEAAMGLAQMLAMSAFAAYRFLRPCV